MSARYAVYLAPHPEDALNNMSAQWLGRSPWSAGPLDPPAVFGQHTTLWREIIAAPRHYGFHATLRAPFEPSAGYSEDALIETVSNFTASGPPLYLNLRVRFLSVFMAFLAEDQEAVAQLGEDLLEVCEPFRSPLSEHDRARRLKAPLSERQIRNLDAWGYPYVGEDFLFHMTLSGPVAEEHRAWLQEAAEAWFAETLAGPVQFKGLAIFHQPDRDTPFRGIHFAPFGTR